MTDAPKKAITKQRERCNCNNLGWLAMRLVKNPLIAKLEAENKKLREDNRLLETKIDDQDKEERFTDGTLLEHFAEGLYLNSQIEDYKRRLRLSIERSQEWYQKYIAELDRSIGRSTV